MLKSTPAQKKYTTRIANGEQVTPKCLFTWGRTKVKICGVRRSLSGAKQHVISKFRSCSSKICFYSLGPVSSPAVSSISTGGARMVLSGYVFLMGGASTVHPWCTFWGNISQFLRNQIWQLCRILFQIFHHKHKCSYSSNHDSEFPVVIWNGQQQKFLIVDIGQGNDIDMFMYTHDFGNVHTS